MKKVLLIFLAITIFLIFIFRLLHIIAHVNKTWQEGKVIQSRVIAVSGNMLLLSDGKILQLAGVYIPVSGANYRKDLAENLKQMVLNKDIMAKVITSPRSKYPEYPLVIADINGIELNSTLIESGMAFFDQGYYKGKDVYYQLQTNAKEQKKGMWGDVNPPKPLLASKKTWQGIHLIDCPKLKGFTEDEIDYYYFVPQYIYWFKYLELDCPYCGVRKPPFGDAADYNIDLAAQQLKEIAQKLNQNK